MKIAYKLAVASLLLLQGCSTVEGWFAGSKSVHEKPAPLVAFKPTLNVDVAWHGSVGAAEDFQFSPKLRGDTLFATGKNGVIEGFNANTGAQKIHIETGTKLSAGIGVGDNLLLAGTVRGELLAYDFAGKSLWKAKVSSEILSAPQVADGIVIVRTGDGHVLGINAADGKQKWMYQRTLPALTVRSFAGVLADSNGVYAGFAGGKLVALSLEGTELWEASVAVPRGATELERITDITSLPVSDGRSICAVAYQGRVACFDAGSGNPIWGRKLSSITGLAQDERNLYISDSHGTLFAVDRATGASVWKQDKLASRQLSTPAVVGNYIAVGDLQGYVHFISRDDGSFAARVATDGSGIQSAPISLPTGVVVQTAKGGVYVITIK